MSDSFTESVARLHRAGSEYSEQTKKLRKAVDTLIEWLTKNIPAGFNLPCNCEVYPSQEFMRRTNFEGRPAFHLMKGNEHTKLQLQCIATLIGTESFLDKLIMALAADTQTYADTQRKVAAFLTNS